jgi:hypothetical protein
VEHFLSNRPTAIAFDRSKEDLRSVWTGILQGSPASPILFYLYLNLPFHKLTTYHLSSWTPSDIDGVAIVVCSKSKVYNKQYLEAAA